MNKVFRWFAACMAIVSFLILLRCGMLPNSKSSDDDEVGTEQNVPADWDGTADYTQSEWTVSE